MQDWGEVRRCVLVAAMTGAFVLAGGGVVEAQASEGEEEEDGQEHDHFRAFYIEASTGYSWLNLGILSADNLAPDAQRVSGSGFNVGGGVGLFVSLFTLGVQVEMAAHDGFDLGVAAIDIGLRGTNDYIEPYFRFGVGYAWMFNMKVFEDVLQVEDQIQGFAADIGLGFDFPINHLVAIGIGVDIALFQLNRSGKLGIPQDAQNAINDAQNMGIDELGDFNPDVEGHAIGIQFTALPSVSLHF